MGMHQLTMRSVMTGLACGIVAGVLIMRIAWEHNPQGVVHESGQIHWGYWLIAGVSWMIPVAAIVGGLTFVFLRAIREPPPPS